MITYTKGNLLDADVEALVNTVNTVGIMGKGIALMFKERFPENMKAYEKACKTNQVLTGKMFVTQTGEMFNPKWIINFPTKQDWRSKSKIEWIEDGLIDLKKFILDNQIKSIAIPPLGAGNGGLRWDIVKEKIESELNSLSDVNILIYEPTAKYQNVRKTTGVETLTISRALVLALVRHYWQLGMECSFLELQKLVWFLQRNLIKAGLKNEINGHFSAHYYGPYANNINYLLNSLDGSYLISNKRISDSKPTDIVWFNSEKEDTLNDYLKSCDKQYKDVLEKTLLQISGFETPFGLELLSTVDWLVYEEGYNPTVLSIQKGLSQWKAGDKWAKRKTRLFSSEKNISEALARIRD